LTLDKFGQLASQEVWGGNANAWNQPQQPAAARSGHLARGLVRCSHGVQQLGLAAAAAEQQQCETVVQQRVGEHGPNARPAAAAAVAAIASARGAIHQLLNIILKLRILGFFPVSTLPYVVIVNNYFLIGE
jgi:hypothetical protein